MTPQEELAKLREQVRAVDERFYQLAAERLALARKIGAVKKAAHLPIKDYQTEKDVLERSRLKALEFGLPRSMGEDLAGLLIRYAVQAQDESHRQIDRAHSAPAQQVLIAGGQGRMGLWLSEFFASFGHHVTHYTPQQVATAGPLRYPLVHDLTAAAQHAGIIVLAAPITATPKLIDQLGDTNTKALVFDICSLKTPLIASIERAQAKGLAIGSVHPMFGPNVDVLAGSNIVLCDHGNAATLGRLRSLFSMTTANLHTVPLAKHDRLMGYVLGLSHLTNLVFAEALTRSGEGFSELNQVASTTFQSQLRLALPVVHENEHLYYEIQVENSFTPQLLQLLQTALQRYGAAISNRDEAAFCQLMTAARGYFNDAAAPPSAAAPIAVPRA